MIAINYYNTSQLTELFYFTNYLDIKKFKKSSQSFKKGVLIVDNSLVSISNCHLRSAFQMPYEYPKFLFELCSKDNYMMRVLEKAKAGDILALYHISRGDRVIARVDSTRDAYPDVLTCFSGAGGKIHNLAISSISAVRPLTKVEQCYYKNIKTI